MCSGEHWSSPNGCHPDCPECAKEEAAEHRRQTQAETVQAIVKHLEDEGITSEHLDQAVHDAMSERASAINNDGLEAQVEFLLRGSDNSWKPGDIIHTARRAKNEATIDDIDADAEADACRGDVEGGGE